MVNHETPPRDREQRKADVLRRLAADESAWVSTAGRGGEPCLVPLDFLWHDGTLVMTTRSGNPTAVNVGETGRASVALGDPTDVVLVDARVEVVASDALPEAAGEGFAAKLHWDVRGRPAWCFLVFHPHTVRAWRGPNEMKGRFLMRDGAWLD